MRVEVFCGAQRLAYWFAVTPVFLANEAKTLKPEASTAPNCGY
jgi:hypothetical protein